MRRILQIITLGALAVVGTAGARADDAAVAPDLSALIDVGALQQEEAVFDEASVVVGASRYAQKTEEAPAAVTILTAEQIRRFGWRTLGEALRTVPGFHVSSDRAYDYLGVRGFLRGGDYTSRVLILVDGHRINDTIYDSGFVDRIFPVDLDLIRRIEVIRGPASSSYGTNAVLGVVNVVTREASSVKGGEVSFATGSFGTLDRRITVGEAAGTGPSWMGSYSSFNMDGQSLYFPEYDDAGLAINGGVSEDVDDERGHHAFAKVSSGAFTFEALSSERGKGLASAPYGILFNDPRGRQVDDHDIAWLSWSRRTGKVTETSATLSYNRYRYHGFFPFEDEADPSIVYLNRDEATGSWWGVEAQSTTTRKGHKLTVGTELRKTVNREYGNFDVEPAYALYLAVSAPEDVWAVFLQDEYRLRPDLLVNVGLRHDQYDRAGGTTNPRVALIHEARRDSLLKLMWGQSFRAPNLFEQDYEGADIYLANPDLAPEETDSWELQWRRILSPSTSVTVGLFRYGIDGLITQVDSQAFPGMVQYVNLGSVDSRGAEIELSRRLRGTSELRLSYTRQKATDEATGQLLTNAPRDLGKLSWLTPMPGMGLVAGVELLATGSRRTEAGATVGGNALVNLTLSGGRGDTTFSVGAYNLLDRRYSDPVSTEFVQDSIAQDGRTVRVKVTYRF